MALVCISFSQLGIQLVYEWIHFHESCHSFNSCPLSHCVSPSQFNVAKSSVLPPDVKSCWDFTPAIKQIFLSVTFESILWLHHTQNSITLFQVLCLRCGIHHGPPSMRLFLLTSAHHPGISLRNKNIVPWGLYALMIDSLAFDIGSPHWPLIKIFN